MLYDVYTWPTRLPVPLPTGGCASAACRMVHTVSSISALSCLSDNTAETDRRKLDEVKDTQRVPDTKRLRRKTEIKRKVRRRSETETGIQKKRPREFQRKGFYCISSCSCFLSLMLYLKPTHGLKVRTRSVCVFIGACLTFLSLNRLLQQKFSHTLPVFEQLLRAFPQRVHKVGCMLMELANTNKYTHRKKHGTCVSFRGAGWKRRTAGILSSTRYYVLFWHCHFSLLVQYAYIMVS